MRIFAFLLIVTLTLISLSVSQHATTSNAGSPVVRADYQRCFTVNPGPLLRPTTRINGDTRRKDIV